MSELADRIGRELEELRTLRDELRVQVHLGKKEARGYFEKAEKSWHEAEAKLELIRRGSREPLEQVAEAARQLVREIGEAYQSIKKLG